ncbi:hypothetical protein ACOSP7_011982 [Xanthoceras sorbifolium]
MSAPASASLSPAPAPVDSSTLLPSSSSKHVPPSSSSVAPILATKSLSLVPTHPMTTRGKDGIFKPKSYSGLAIDLSASIPLHLIEPTTVKSTLCIPDGRLSWMLNIKLFNVIILGL